ncbi:MAG TPA: alpha/beta fold hydrolase [Polyangiaceae bacterium]|jgi:pimeloyl-ACP methyl ester carboxylesterase|nr:alpha/beta fold hydrolase [Polyangiaceae bacterium]
MSRQPALPIVYLPGASGRSAVFHGIAARLERRRPTVSVDYPGLGDAPADAGVSSVAELVEFVARRAPALVDVVAISMGALVALNFALEHPASVRRLVLIAPAGGVDVVGLGGVDWRAAFVAQRPTAPRWLVNDRTDLSDRLTSVVAPTLLILGDRDPIAPVAIGTHLQEHLPDARLEIVPGATHDIEDEAPDVVAALIEAHLRRA